MTEVTRERFDRNDGLVWRRGALETNVYQAQGFDIVAVQKRRGKPQRSVWNYSEPGFYLFACMLNYHRRTVGNLPPVEELQHVLGNRSGFYAEGYRVEDSHVMLEVDANVSECTDGAVLHDQDKRPLFVGSYMSDINYLGFMEGTRFVIASNIAEGADVKLITRTPERDFERRLRREIILEPDDAMRVMKTIYYFAGDKKGLEKVYTNTK